MLLFLSFTCIESHHKLQSNDDIVEVVTQVIYIYVYFNLPIDLMLHVNNCFKD
jgi:hypothetical protein